MADNTKTLKMWQEAAAETKECLPLETLERMMDNPSGDAKAAAHLAGCAHCQTELAMLKNFEQSTPSADEGAAVAWIASQLAAPAERFCRPAKSSPDSLLAHHVPRALYGRSSGTGRSADLWILSLPRKLRWSWQDQSGTGQRKFSQRLNSSCEPDCRTKGRTGRIPLGGSPRRKQLFSGTERRCGNHAGKRQVIAECAAGNPGDESQHGFRQAAQMESYSPGRGGKRDRKFKCGAVRDQVKVRG